MPAKVEIPREVCERWIALCQRTDLTYLQVAEIIRDEHPNLFKKGIKLTSIHEHLRRYAHEHGLEYTGKARVNPKAHYRYLDEVPELVIPYKNRVIVLSDLHASGHDDRIVELAAKVIRDEGITTAIFNGDQLDNSYKGHKGIRSRWSATYEENVQQFTDVANYLKAAGLVEQFAIQGNHDDKPLRETDGEMTYPMWWNAILRDHLDEPDSYTVTHRYYLIMQPEIPKPWPWPDGFRNFPWYFMHQAEYSKIPLRVASGHASVVLGNVICGHQHHLAQGWHDSGKLKVADAGTFQHKEAAAYKVNRPTKHPQWNQGFLTLIDNTVQIHELR